MFERFSERARRVIFFARYDASQLGSSSIEIEHMLLGILREDRALLERLLPEKTDLIARIRPWIEERSTVGKKTSTAMDMLMSDACQRALKLGVEEADRLSHSRVVTGHLLLGLLGEDHLASRVLRTDLGISPDLVRKDLRTSYETESSPDPQPAAQNWVPDGETAIRIAEAVLIPIVGAETLDERRPLEATPKGDKWFVTSGGRNREDRLSAVIGRDGRVFGAGQGGFVSASGKDG